MGVPIGARSYLEPPPTGTYNYATVTAPPRRAHWLGVRGMETKVYHTRDKAEWGTGPWQDEPDKKQWLDVATRLPCIILRGPSGALCGYVGVTQAHPAFGADCNADVLSPLRVHGGLTFSDKCMEEPTRERWEKWRKQIYGQRSEAEGFPRGDAARRLKERAVELEDYDAFAKWAEAAYICHKVEVGEDDNVWWLGFDCAHAFDLAPAFQQYADLTLESSKRLERRHRHETYRDWPYVESEVLGLAKQLVEMTKAGDGFERFRRLGEELGK